jgi:hypothetical protein
MPSKNITSSPAAPRQSQASATCQADLVSLLDIIYDTLNGEDTLDHPANMAKFKALHEKHRTGLAN